MNTSLRLLSFLLMSTFGFAAQAQQTRPDSTTSSPRPVYTVVPQPPKFTGGMDKLHQYLRKNMRYPKSAREGRVEGRVFVKFTVNEQGGLEDISVLKGIDPDMDAEAVRLVQEMPAWIPGKINEKPVACRYNLVIEFSL